MEIFDLMEKTNKAINIAQIDDAFVVETNATLLNGSPIEIHLEKRGLIWFLTDNKKTLKYMNDLYELSSKDVKLCISNVLKVYGFSINAGLLMAEISDPDVFMEKLFDFIMCIGQLTNMFAFFDKP